MKSFKKIENDLSLRNINLNQCNIKLHNIQKETIRKYYLNWYNLKLFQYNYRFQNLKQVHVSLNQTSKTFINRFYSSKFNTQILEEENNRINVHDNNLKDIAIEDKNHNDFKIEYFERPNLSQFNLNHEQIDLVKKMLHYSLYPSIEDKKILQNALSLNAAQLNMLLYEIRKLVREIQSTMQEVASTNNISSKNEINPNMDFNIKNEGCEVKELNQYEYYQDESSKQDSTIDDSNQAKLFIKTWISKHSRQPTKLEFIILWKKVKQYLSKKQLYNFIWQNLQYKSEITSEKKKIVIDALKLNKKLSKEEIEELKNVTNLNTLQIKRIIFSYFESHGKINQEKREKLRYLFQVNNYKITIKQLRQWSNELEIGLLQIRSFFESEKTRKVFISLEKKKLLRKYFKNNEFNLQNIDQLSQTLNLPNFIIKHYYRYYSKNHEKITQDKKRYIIDWIKDNPKATKEDIRNLANNIGSNFLKVHSIIRHSKEFKGHITNEKIQELKNWFDDHSQNLSKQDIIAKSKNLNLSIRQVENILWKFENPPGTFTTEAKNVISTYLNSEVTSKTIENISLKTGLNNKQIINYLHRLKNKSESIAPFTNESKNFILNYISINPNLSKSDYEIIQENTSLNKNQIQSFIWRIRNKPKDPITPEKKKTVENWLKKNDFQSPTHQDMNLIQKETGLTRLQLRGLMNRLLHKHTTSIIKNQL